MSKKKKKHSGYTGEKSISFVNWFFTLLFSILPGVNLVFFILSACLARTASKRRFAAAALVLTLVVLIGLALMLFFYSSEIVGWCNTILADDPPVNP